MSSESAREKVRPSDRGEKRRALLERDDVITELDRIVGEAGRSGEGSIVLLAGEAGVGKSSVVEALLESLGPGVRAAVGRCQPLATAGPLVPIHEIIGALSGAPGDEASPYLVARGLLQHLAAAPTFLVLEDVHWADEATLDVLRVLSRRIGPTPSVALVTYRDDGLRGTGPLRGALGELGGRLLRVRLRPLSREAVAELAEGSQMDVDELIRRTGGNPFFVTEVLASPGEPIPESVRDAVLSRLGRLGDPAVATAEAIAVIPGKTEIWLLEAITGPDLAGLDQLLGSGIVLAQDHEIAFRHELARLAVADSTATLRRLGLHRAALAALVEGPMGPADPARLAHHARAAGDPVLIGRWAPRAAAAAAAAGSHNEAAAHYADALERGADPGPSGRADLLEALADERFLINEFQAAAGDLDRALAIRRRLGEAPRVGTLLCRLASVRQGLGKTSEADALATEAVELLEPLGEGPELAEAYAARAQMRMLIGDLEGTERWGVQAIRLAERLGVLQTLAHAQTSLGSARLEGGRPGGRELLARALELARREGFPTEAARALNNLVSGSITVHRYRQAASYIDDGLRYCAEHGLELWERLLLSDRTALALEGAEWDLALQGAEEILSEDACSPPVRLQALVVAAAVGLRRGDADRDVGELLAEALDLAEAEGTWWSMRLVACLRCEATWLGVAGGDAEEVTAAALALAEEAEDDWSIGELALWRRRLGIRERAPDILAEPPRLSLAGDRGAAAAAWEEIGSPYRAALALADSDEDEEVLEAHRRLVEIGAEAAARSLAARLRAQGVQGVPRGPRSRTRENPAGLTPREMEVAVLLTEELRNSQIAERLVVSEKTVDHHVSSVLAKLGVADRRAAAVELGRLGIGAES